MPILRPSTIAYRSLVLVSSEDSVSYCLETEGSVLESTSDCLSCSGILSLELVVKGRTRELAETNVGLVRV